jgi:hypothetical protein
MRREGGSSISLWIGRKSDGVSGASHLGILTVPFEWFEWLRKVRPPVIASGWVVGQASDLAGWYI